MVDMSDCRFHISKQILIDCIKAIESSQIESKYEIEQAKNMFKLFLDFCKKNNIIEDYNKELIYEILESSIHNVH